MQATDSRSVTFEAAGKGSREGEAPTILDAAAEQSIALRSDCGGKGICGKCRVVVFPLESVSDATGAESRLLDPRQISEGQRLACQAKILKPVKVSIPVEARDRTEAFGKSAVRGTYPIDPLVRRLVLNRSEDGAGRGDREQGLVERISGRVRELTGEHPRFSDLAAVCEMSHLPGNRDDLTLVWHKQRGVTAVLERRCERSLGVAMDLGTTTIAVYLCDLLTGAVLSSAAGTNPQRRFGEDVVSRIAFAKANTSGTRRLQEIVIEEVNLLILRCLAEIGCTPRDVDEVVAVGNTTMQHLFLGINPQSLGISPYTPVLRSALDVRAQDIGLRLNPGTNVHVFPAIAGFIGGDTLAAILAEEPHRHDGTTLIVDLGTNGELVLGNRNGLWATSCAMGPALEGAHISSGMRAAFGAIHRVDIDPQTCRVHYETLGGEDGISPTGICGSGIVDTVAAMCRAGLLLENGRMQEGLPGVEIDGRGRGDRFVLVHGERSATGNAISLALSDIRQIQLAKAALSAGIVCLMQRTGVTRVDRLVLTGAFGVRFDWKNAVDIGMLPGRNLFSTVAIVENAAGIGAVMALLDGKRRIEAREVAGRVRFLDLANDPVFTEEFPARMGFPPYNVHTRDADPCNPASQVLDL